MSAPLTPAKRILFTALALALLAALVDAAPRDFHGAYLHPSIPEARIAELVPPQTHIFCAQDLPCNWSGNNTHSGTETFGSINNVKYLDGTKYVQNDGGLTAAISDAGTNGTVVIPSGVNVSITSSHTILANYLIIRCEPGGILTAGAALSGGMFVLTGTGNRIQDCQFAPGSFAATLPIYLNGAINALVAGNTFSGFTGGSATGVYLTGTSKAVVRQNWCTAGSGGTDCIFGEKNAIDTIVDDNKIDQSLGGATAHAIAFHSTIGGQTVSGTQIINNNIIAGVNFCVELGAFGGATPTKLVVSNNVCKMGINGAGGYSIGSAAQYWVISNNVFDANGFTPTIGGIESAVASDGVISGNSVNGGQITLSNSNSSRITITGNTISNWPSPTGVNSCRATFGCAGILLTTSVTNGTVQGNTVSNNTIKMPAGVASIAINEQCNATGAVCSGNVYSGNNVISDGTANSVGIFFTPDVGTMSGDIVGGSSNLSGPNFGIGIGTGATGTRIDPGFLGTISDSGTNTIKPTGTGAVVQSVSPTITGTVAGGATYTSPALTTPSIGGTTISNVPVMEATCYFRVVNAASQNYCPFDTTSAITVIRVLSLAGVAPAGCTTSPQYGITGQAGTFITNANGANSVDSGAISVNVAGGINTTIGVENTDAGCTTQPSDVEVVILYRMQ